MLNHMYQTGDDVIYISDVHQVYQGEVATITEFDLEHRLAGLKFSDGEIIFAFWDEIKPIGLSEKETVHLSLTVDELLLIRKAMDWQEHERMYEWQSKIHEKVQEKLKAAYQKPIMTETELEVKLEEERKELRALKLQDVEHFILAGKRCMYELRYEIKK
ncbi:hypothetical protein [[Clostridium] symbiosum]|uniref:hypothetical protein n=1 Tax=Clostridium symbiosum TaxID=1512 RepID=UPI0034A1686E